MCSALEQFPDLRVEGLREILVPTANGVKRLGCFCADSLVYIAPEQINDPRYEPLLTRESLALPDVDADED